MGKKSYVPKKVAGFKVPKSVRKSKMLSSLLGSHAGREILGASLTAGAGAVAAALAQPRDSLRKGGKRRSVVGLVSEAVTDGAHAAMGVVADAARNVRGADDAQAVRNSGAKRRH